MEKEDKISERTKRYLERQRKDLAKQREQLMKQTQERKEQSRISIQMEMRKTSTPKVKDTDNQIQKDDDIHTCSPVLPKGKKPLSRSKASEHTRKERASAQKEYNLSQYLGSLENASLPYEDIHKTNVSRDPSDASFGIARLLADIDKYKVENPVINVQQQEMVQEPKSVSSFVKQNVVKDNDKRSETNTALTDKQTDVSDKQGQTNAQSDGKVQADVVPGTSIPDRDSSQVSIPAVPVSHKKVETDTKMDTDQLPHVSKVHIEHIDHTNYGTTHNIPSTVKSQTISVTRTEDTTHGQSVPVQKSNNKTSDGSIEQLRTSVSEAHNIEDRTKKSQTGIIEDNYMGIMTNTQQQYDMTDTQTEKEELTKQKTMKRHIYHKKDDEQTELKEKETYEEFINRGKQMLHEVAERMEYDSEESDTAEENIMLERIQKLKLQDKLLEEENQKKAEEAKKMVERMKAIKTEEEKLEKERKKMLRLSLLRQKEALMEREIQMKIKKQREEDYYLRKRRKNA